MTDGAELIEEGLGFGVPIAKYFDRTYFSSSAEVFLQKQSRNETVVTKNFFLDAVSKKWVHGVPINDDFYSLLHKTFEAAYLNRDSFSTVFDWTMRLRIALGVQTRFLKVTPRGKVTVTYHCLPGFIKVNVDLSALDRTQCQEILVLNEQGAGFFRKYSDTDGTLLYDREIGPWAKVKANQASLSDLEGRLTFWLQNVNGSGLYRGREQIKDRFSWAGLSYALNPNTPSFDYAIRISAASPR
jgi:hypothetical protein